MSGICRVFSRTSWFGFFLPLLVVGLVRSRPNTDADAFMFVAVPRFSLQFVPAIHVVFGVEAQSPRVFQVDANQSTISALCRRMKAAKRHVITDSVATMNVERCTWYFVRTTTNRASIEKDVSTSLAQQYYCRRVARVIWHEVAPLVLFTSKSRFADTYLPVYLHWQPSLYMYVM